MIEIFEKRWAAVYSNEKFLCVQSLSGLRRKAIDPMGVDFYFSHPVSIAELGQAVQNALLKSRVIKVDEVAQFFDVKAVEERYEFWVESMMSRFDYVQRKSLFKNMLHCEIEYSNNVILVTPTIHEKLEAWSSNKEIDGKVRIPGCGSIDEIGEGVLLALEMCL